MTAPVALFLTLLSVQLSNELVSATHAKESSTLDEGLTYDNQSLDMYIDMVSSTVRRSFVREAVVGLLSTVQGASLLSKALLSHQFYDLGREAALCESMNDVRALLVAEAESLCYAFETPAEVKKLLSKITAVKDSEPAKHVQATFGITANQTNWDDIFQKADWTSNWRSLTIALFSNEAVLDRASVLIANEIGSKMAAGRLFSQDFLDKLKEISSARKNRKVSREEKIRLIACELSSFEHVSKSLSLLRSIGVDMTKIDDAARSVREEKATARAAVDSDLMRSVLDSIRARHPNWVKAGVLRPEIDFNSTPSMVHEMVRMFVRLSYMPHTGAAAIAQHTRRRIGNIGTESYQYNVPAEFGFVEQYDNLQYKRYDWQGWYQRMVDIHNRNVSIRCRIDDLKRLDSDGNPLWISKPSDACGF
ncbi:hypothetical protein AGDE_13155 [Angomonas deanei]|uniref:Uncharacterized protein n=1 Tax=Angomonas deanei TaxID=59799 RepID=A0A7G2C7K0_9TRYP|nr:hypothetical protein AGDE_13155 [Angomonas deanei]CAD2215559.1 hypothetical protein, conserved [Angomonas deanei]|eukprot:EPY22698.1 hypothetical protein AGDE_13155 [Angomonas deanei]